MTYLEQLKESLKYTAIGIYGCVLSMFIVLIGSGTIHLPIIGIGLMFIWLTIQMSITAYLTTVGVFHLSIFSGSKIVWFFSLLHVPHLIIWLVPLFIMHEGVMIWLIGKIISQGENPNKTLLTIFGLLY